MPGPIIGLPASMDDSANDLSVFESCEDMQQTWGELNGNFSNESLYHECNKQYSVDYQRKYVNGSELQHSKINSTDRLATESATTKTTSLEKNTMDSETSRQVQETGLICVKECLEDMDVEDGTMKETVETINFPVVEACLNVDITTALTRQKIASLQKGRTLSYADKEDTEEPPTRRSPRQVHANDSIDVRTPHRSFANHESQEKHKLSPVVCRAIRVSRNPSYQSAVKDATILSPKHVGKTESLDKNCTSCDGSPVRVERSIEIIVEASKVADSSKRHASLGDEIDTPLATNMGRSVSFSGPEVLSPSPPANGSLSEGNSRCGSVSQLSSPSSQQSVPLSADKTSPSIVRGSALTRSFRRLFSTPARTTPTSPPEEFWLDIPDLHPSTPNSEAKSSRLRKLSNSFSRRLSTRSKMSGQGTNSPQFFTANGTAMHEDSRNLVEYEDLLKLFCCPGCQLFMAPPLYQCRKGHLVCSTCRYSLKQACPTCKQRFADNTNMMMEQVGPWLVHLATSYYFVISNISLC